MRDDMVDQTFKVQSSAAVCFAVCEQILLQGVENTFWGKYMWSQINTGISAHLRNTN